MFAESLPQLRVNKKMTGQLSHEPKSILADWKTWAKATILSLQLGSVSILFIKLLNPRMRENRIPESARWRFRAAMILAMAADALQIFVFPLFAEGALSPADDVLDIAVAAVLVHLLGWHWEFLPAFAAELVPGVDLVPFWTLAVISVYRKWKQITVAQEQRDEPPVIEGEYKSS
jgi:hypothetical protein